MNSILPNFHLSDAIFILITATLQQISGIRSMLTSHQIRAARALLRWSARQLAQKSGVHVTTVQRMERGDGPVGGTLKTLAKIQSALENPGIEFTSQNGRPGVRLKKR